MVSHLVVLNEQIPVLILAMTTVHLLLQTFRWLLCSVGSVHQIIWVRHAMLTGLPGARIDARWDFIEIVLRHTAHFNGHLCGVLGIDCELLRLFRHVKIIDDRPMRSMILTLGPAALCILFEVLFRRDVFGQVNLTLLDRGDACCRCRFRRHGTARGYQSLHAVRDEHFFLGDPLLDEFYHFYRLIVLDYILHVQALQGMIHCLDLNLI